MTTAAPGPDIETSSDAYAQRFAGASGAYMLDRQRTLVDALLSDKTRVSILEVGGGHAQLSGALAARGHDVTVLGSARSCRTRLLRDPLSAGVGFVEGSLVTLPFADASFDTVVAIRLMAHIDDWRRLVAELARVARGTVLIDLPVWTSSNALSVVGFGIKKAIEGDTRQYRSFWGPEVSRAFRANGMRVSARRGQFVLPMALHRAGRCGTALQRAEAAFDRCGISSAFGNPMLLRADTVG
jgi:SAM-dependent methyltransferase